MPLGSADFAIVAVYLAAMIAAGWYFSGRTRHFKDYFLAGGALTTPLLVCTLVSTYYELDVTFATSERAYYNGMAAWFWLSRPYYVAILLAAVLVAKRLRGHGYYTLPDVVGARYGDGARVTVATACFVYSLPITALAGMGALFETLGLPRDIGLFLGASVCAVYTLMGGLWADVITDTVQFVLMCLAVAILIPYALEWSGGFGFTDHLPGAHLTASGGLSPWLIAAWSAGALTVFVEPAFYQRIFAARSEKDVTRALIIGIFLWAAYDWGVTLVGMIARSAVEQGMLAEGLPGRTALLTLAMTLLPVGLKGLFIGGVLAAAMSSVDSYSLLASGNLVYDIWRPLVRPQMTDQQLVRATRIGVFAVTLGGLALSFAFDRISDAWIFMSSVLASVAFVPVLGAVFLKPARQAGLASSLAGLLSLAAFYICIYGFGTYNADEESWVWQVGGTEIWREYGVLVALPISAAAFAVANMLSREPRS